MLTSTKGPGVYPGHLVVSERRGSADETSTKGPGVYPGHWRSHRLSEGRTSTSTKGPGVYPGHGIAATETEESASPQRRDREFIPVISSPLSVKDCGITPQRRDREFIPVMPFQHVIQFVVDDTSTKGPGVYPGHQAGRGRCRVRLPTYLNEGTGSLSRSSQNLVDLFIACALTSTKGPGVYPGHLVRKFSRADSTAIAPQRRDREFIPVISHRIRQVCHSLNLNEGTGSLSRSYWQPCRGRTPFCRHLNEGTGSLSRSFARCRPPPCTHIHLNEGTGSLSRSSRPRCACRIGCPYLNEGTGSLSRSLHVLL